MIIASTIQTKKGRPKATDKGRELATTQLVRALQDLPTFKGARVVLLDRDTLSLPLARTTSWPLGSILGAIVLQLWAGLASELGGQAREFAADAAHGRAQAGARVVLARARG